MEGFYNLDIVTSRVSTGATLAPQDMEAPASGPVLAERYLRYKTLLTILMNSSEQRGTIVHACGAQAMCLPPSSWRGPWLAMGCRDDTYV